MTPDPTAFEDSYRWVAFPAGLTGSIDQLVAAYGAPASDAGRVFVTLLCGWDDKEQTRKQALEFSTTAGIQTLSDGRKGAAGLWSKALVALWQAGHIEAEELTEDQFRARQPEGDV
jgi:hypothetical protein